MTPMETVLAQLEGEKMAAESRKRWALDRAKVLQHSLDNTYEDIERQNARINDLDTAIKTLRTSLPGEDV